jgi:hypothetical protein
MALFEPIFAALDAAQARYVVVGGVAVVLQGFPRLTADLDLVIDLEPGACRRAVTALVDLGLEPRAPVPAHQFAEPDRRRQWIEEKGMEVFSLYDPSSPLLTVDLFVRSPLPFEELWGQADVVRIGNIDIRVASIPHLLAMKRRVGRPQDREDVRQLEAIQQDREVTDGE